MKIYCPQCGSPTAYAGAKPKSCSSCGNALSALAKKEKEEQKNYEIHEDIDVEENPSESLNLDNMNALQVEINYQQNNKVTFGQLMKDSADAELDGDINFTEKQSVPQRSPDQIMQDFQKEAGTLRNKNG